MKVITNPRIELSKEETIMLDTMAQQWEEVCEAYGDCETCPFDDLCNICNPGEYFKQFLKACGAGPVYGDVESCKEVAPYTKRVVVDSNVSLNPQPLAITIKEINEDVIIFSDNSCITYGHEQDCCEHNYADFSQIDDLARNHKFITPLKFERVREGFQFGDSQRMFFVPCYSEQNGYYTNDVDIYYNGVCQCKVQAKWIEV